MPKAIEVVFFDIGNTLGKFNPITKQLDVFPSTVPLLKGIRDKLTLRVGVITTLGSLSDADGRALLNHAGLSSFLDPLGFVSEHTAGGVSKPDIQIYRFAAQQMGVPIEQCLFVGESFIEVIGAVTAGMKVLLKPNPPGGEVL